MIGAIKAAGFVSLFLFVLSCPSDLPSVTAEDRFVEALVKGNAELCREISPDLEDYDRITVAGREFSLLDRVARKEMWALIPLLLEYGADPEAINFDGRPVIETVASQMLFGKKDFDRTDYDFLIEHGVSPSSMLGQSADLIGRIGTSSNFAKKMKAKAMNETYINVIRWSLDDDADVDLEINDAPVLYWVAKGGSTAAVRILLDAGANPDAEYYWKSYDRHETAYEVTTSTEVKALLENAGARY